MKNNKTVKAPKALHQQIDELYRKHYREMQSARVKAGMKMKASLDPIKRPNRATTKNGNRSGGVLSPKK